MEAKITEPSISAIGDNGEDFTYALKIFSKQVDLERIIPGCYSFLLTLDLFLSYQIQRLNPAFVIDEIVALESGLKPSGFKPPIQNKHPPLRGLWHKHYRQNGMRSLAMNVRKGINRYGIPAFEEMVDAAKSTGEDRFLDPTNISRITDDVISGNLGRLAASNNMTGEWLLFTEFEGAKYYLGLCSHERELHESVRRNIENICCHEFPEFPFLLNILNPE